MTKRTRFSRRALLATATLAPAASGQQPPAQPAAGAEIDAVRRQQQSDYEQLRKVSLPFTVEPATVFKP